MAGINKVIIVGHLGNDPEMRSMVERPRPAPKEFPINHQSAVCFLHKLHLSNFYE